MRLYTDHRRSAHGGRVVALGKVAEAEMGDVEPRQMIPHVRLTYLLHAIAMMLFAGLPPGSASGAADAKRDIVIGHESSMHSKILGEDRRYSVYLPASYEATGSRTYPVLYLLDGGAHDKAAVGLIHHLGSYSSAVLRIPETIVIAVPNTKRTRDLTPTHATSGPYSQGSGGAATFLRFIRHELFPLIESRYRTSPERTLVGHSLGGLFALHVLLEQPDSFHHYIAIDPSLWWDEQFLVRRAAQSSALQIHSPASLFIAHVSASTSSDADREFQAAHDRAIQQFREVFERRDNERLRMQYTFFEDETHLSVPLIAMYRGLLFVHAGFKPDSAREKDL